MVSFIVGLISISIFISLNDDGADEITTQDAVNQINNNNSLCIDYFRVVYLRL